ncbi:unnamed protein product [Phytophthora lilii]|uniref:Unnamed protein product n=1 Tax=Phytophthora lilii TaxID=2077276 RepID=A0A9W6TBU9_9STRA|nr:unnamed protein product [Phytophthora lilii]
MTKQRECDNCDQESARLRGQELTMVPPCLFFREHVRRVDLSFNGITRFPGARVALELPCLEVLALSNNLLHVLEDILALASAPRLCELDLRDNPLRLSQNRLYLLETLLFQDVIIDEDILRELYRDERLKNFTSTSELVTKLLYRSYLPRRRGFPMLQVLNCEWISDFEIRQAEVERGKSIEYFRSLICGGKKGRLGARRKIPKNTTQNGIKVNERRFDGSRMTIKQMLRNEARITAIPLPQVLKRYRIDVESFEEVDERPGTAECPNLGCPEIKENDTTNEHSDDGNGEDEIEHSLLQRLFRPLSSLAIAVNTTEEAEKSVALVKPATAEPWNYPISTFDDLQSDERQYIRYKSKHVGGTLERDDHFFESTTFLDCVAQCERSRRLTIRAADLLTQPLSATDDPSNQHSSATTNNLTQSAQSLLISDAAAALTNNLNANFTKQHARESFDVCVCKCAKWCYPLTTSLPFLTEVGDYLLGKHIVLRQKTNQLLHGQAANEIRWRDNAHGIEASLEESLSKVKLRNAVDLANTLGDSKEQKRLNQALIDADAKVIEDERVMEEHKSHIQRLRRINARQVVSPQIRRDVELAKKLASLHAAKMKLLEQAREENETASSTTSRAISSRRGRRALPSRIGPKIKSGVNSTLTSENLRASKDNSRTLQVAAKFRTIETVEKAALDPLVEVSSHDLLVRCSDIRQNKDKHVKALAMHRDRFLDDEAEWEHMRQDPINVVRRHLRRALYQDEQQIQIGTMQYFYSPVFQ